MPAKSQLTGPQWGIALMRTLGNMSPSVELQVFMSAWIQAEGGGGTLVIGSTNRCQGNALNTCEPMPGSVHCSSVNAEVCVQSYLSNNDGIYANARALRNGNYPYLLQALTTNDANSLGFNGHKMSSGVAGDLSYWVSGSRTANLGYAAKVAQIAGAQPLHTSSTTNIPTQGNTQGGTQTSTSGGTNPLDALNPLNILGPNTLAWLQDPTRIIKMLVGILCIGIALFLLITPEAAQTVSKVAPFLV